VRTILNRTGTQSQLLSPDDTVITTLICKPAFSPLAETLLPLGHTYSSTRLAHPLALALDSISLSLICFFLKSGEGEFFLVYFSEETLVFIKLSLL